MLSFIFSSCLPPSLSNRSCCSPLLYCEGSPGLWLAPLPTEIALITHSVSGTHNGPALGQTEGKINSVYWNLFYFFGDANQKVPDELCEPLCGAGGLARKWGRSAARQSSSAGRAVVPSPRGVGEAGVGKQPQTPRCSFYYLVLLEVPGPLVEEAVRKHWSVSSHSLPGDAVLSESLRGVQFMVPRETRSGLRSWHLL